eukprot:CAMPEP_0171084572 /NCGR_PEP_ID=MMETSP0766_2-20121228/18398_1 /TAXON_ID=439317 /ORGANISM="Gambierdiscus australes, Strain CAWD 149" /LENGTH=247 /DNA_ID=CAMNT_0011542085 /DNA_START=90 /DNA_END=830 /DNA_ORIENTATION=+
MAPAASLRGGAANRPLSTFVPTVHSSSAVSAWQQWACRLPAEASAAPRRHTGRGPRRVARAATDPNFAANVGQAIDVLRQDHARLPAATPGFSVADPNVALDLAQVPALRFNGLLRYREFWDNFRTGVQLVSTAARSEVVQVVHSGLYIRMRWKLLLVPRAPGGEAAAGALRVARASLGQAGLGGWLQRAGGLLDEAEQWAAGAAAAAQEEREVELNSIYELDCWNGRIVRHTLEFRSPNEDFGLLG